MDFANKYFLTFLFIAILIIIVIIYFARKENITHLKEELKKLKYLNQKEKIDYFYNNPEKFYQLDDIMDLKKELYTTSEDYLYGLLKKAAKNGMKRKAFMEDSQKEELA